MTTFRNNIARITGKKNFTKQEWNLKKEGETEQIAIIIPKALWTFHFEQCKVDHRNRRRIKHRVIIERTMNCMEILKDTYEKQLKNKENKNNTINKKERKF